VNKYLEKFYALPKWLQWLPLVILLAATFLIGAVIDAKKVQAKPIYTLGMTIEQFVQNLNAKQSQFVIQNAQLTQKGDGFLYLNHQFDKNSILVGVVNETDRSTRSITIILTVSGKDEVEQMMSAMSIPLLISLTIQSLNPTIDKTIIGPAVMDLVDSAISKPDQMHHYILNGNNYAVAFTSTDKAYVFSAAPENLPQSQ
jgi:hypothetical protein